MVSTELNPASSAGRGLKRNRAATVLSYLKGCPIVLRIVLQNLKRNPANLHRGFGSSIPQGRPDAGDLVVPECFERMPVDKLS